MYVCACVRACIVWVALSNRAETEVEVFGLITRLLNCVFDSKSRFRTADKSML